MCDATNLYGWFRDYRFPRVSSGVTKHNTRLA